MAAKAELLDEVVGLARDRLPGAEARGFGAFARRYYESVAEEELAGRDPLDVYGAALSHWEFAQRREVGVEKIRVYTPDLERHGWESPRTIVEVVGDDMPFLVDSVSMELNRHGFGIHLIIHPVVRVRRDAEGRLVELLAPGEGTEDALAESFIHVEVDRQTEPRRLEELHDCLHRVLREVRAAVENWQGMRAAMREAVAELDAPDVDPEELEEMRDFLRWVEDHNFTFLGYREYERGGGGLRPVAGSGLGVLREDEPWPSGCGSLERSASPEELRGTGGPLVLGKAGARATVHRPSRMDHVAVRRFGEGGEVVGERRFLGLYTSTAYRSRPWEIPLIRRKARRVLQRAGFPEDSHDGKALVDILETYPRDELFQATEDELYETAMGILNLQERLRVRLFVRRDPDGRYFSCLVFLPRDRYDTAVRERMQGILVDALGGVGVEHDAWISESVLARVHFVVHTRSGEAPDYDVREVEARIAGATRSWADELRGALVERFGEERGIALQRRYEQAFPPGYGADFPVRSAAADVERLEELTPAGDLLVSLYRPPGARGGALRFKLFRSGEPIPLSRVVPVLENLGVTVVDERPYAVRPAGASPAWVYDFGLALGAERPLTEGLKEDFEEAFVRVWGGEVENDGLNRLVLGAGLTWRQVSVLRAYSRYLRQTGTTFSLAYMEETLAAHPETARLLVELFEVRFDPSRREGAEGRADRLILEIEERLDRVESLDEDRILRNFLALVLATLRTNHFQKDEGGASKPYLSLKLDPRKIPRLPLPRPRFEVFVYSPRVEGVHLRGGKVARGGIRWSDRREDFRTEILGLMKAQMVKNAVIVPVGAKGGFVVKRPPAEGGREAFMREGVRCYETLIRGMLDLTDNLVGDRTVAPTEVVRYDGDDPYLVVAADKGTATFSDIANGISQEYGFWLGDAFASGGSAGYDHKAMGITARGAWESVKRHFRELVIDPQKDDFTVVGIGDMSGDVFGNGMLLSRHIKLVGAFDHRHVFLDPDPDPEKSYEERKRLFGMARSSWADYDEALISEGGGVFERTAKSIPLSAEIKRILGAESDSLTPDEVISALLTAPVDLLYNGGIGTYVKASDESDAEVGDRSNDAVRVDAKDLRCRAVAEGGNLGFTQRGRVEYAVGGGKINTDAVDNSAGVDLSDHEVNIKILLDAVVKSGDMTGKQRDELLFEMADEVASLVLRDNRDQNRALSLAAARAGQMVEAHARYVRALEDPGKLLDRALESLPDEEAFSERKAVGLGLTSPELAVLLAYAKTTLKGELLASDAPDDPYFLSKLERYFPTALRERFRDEMGDHRLRRELVATGLANEVVNRAGITFAFRAGEETDAAPPEVVRAYAISREVFGARDLWARVEALDYPVPVQTQTEMFLELRGLIERGVRWLLRNRRYPLDLAAEVSLFSPVAAELAALLPDLSPAPEREALVQGAERLVAAGVPPEPARRVAASKQLFSTLDIAEVAAATGEPVEAVAAVYFSLGGRLELGRLRERVEGLPGEDRRQGLARAALLEEFHDQQAALTAEVLRSTPGERRARARLDAWVAANREPVDRALRTLADLEDDDGFSDLATLTVALREIHNLVHRGTRLAPGPTVPSAR